MMRFDLINSVRPLRPASSVLERSLFTYSQALNDPFAEIESLINKGVTAEELFGSFLCKAEPQGLIATASLPRSSGNTMLGHGGSAYEPTQIATRVGMGSVGQSGPGLAHQDTHVAPHPPALQSSPTKTQWTPGHIKAANVALGNFHQNKHYEVLSNEGPQAAQAAGHNMKAAQFKTAAANMPNVEVTPEHHKDLMEFHRTPMSSVGGHPVQSELSPMEQWAAHHDAISKPPEVTAATASRPKPLLPGESATPKRPSASLSTIPASRSSIMDLRPQPLLVPHAQDVAPDFTTGVGSRFGAGQTSLEGPTRMQRSMVAIIDLWKSADDLRKDEYAAYGSQETENKPEIKLPSLWPEHRQESRVSKERSAKKQRQVEQSFQTQKSLDLLNHMMQIS